MTLPFYITRTYETSLTEDEIHKNFDSFVELVNYRMDLGYSTGREEAKTYLGNWQESSFMALKKRKRRNSRAFEIVVLGKVFTTQQGSLVEVTYRMPKGYLFILVGATALWAYISRSVIISFFPLLFFSLISFLPFIYKYYDARKTVEEVLLKPSV